jgi:hypothetical protein
MSRDVAPDVAPESRQASLGARVLMTLMFRNDPESAWRKPRRRHH